MTGPDPRAALQLRDLLMRRIQNPQYGPIIASIVTHDDTNEDEVFQMAASILHATRAGVIYYVSPEVSYLLAHAAAALKPEHLIHFNPEDFPSRFGLVYFDGNELEMPSWGDLIPQYLRGYLFAADTKLWLWTIVQDASDDAMPRSSFGAHFRHCIDAPWGVNKDLRDLPQVYTYREETIERYKNSATPYLPEEDPAFEDERAQRAVEMAYRVMYAWAQLINEPLLEVTDHALPRADRRRSEKAGEEPPVLKLVHLRRVEHVNRDRPDDISEVNWTRRWLVSGHWRNQPYGPRDNPTYRARWINPFIKGPDDKPLVVSERVVIIDR